MATVTQIRTLFDAIGEGEWAELSARMERRSYEPGDAVIAQGAVEPDFHVIVEGHARIVAANVHGTRRELGTVGPGDPVGDMSLLTGEPASADVIATTPVVAFAVRQQDLATLGELRPRLFEALATLLAGRLRNANARLMARGDRSAYAVVCSPSTMPALARLPAEVARVTGSGTLAVMIEAAPGADGASAMAAPNVQVHHVSGDDVRDLPRLLDRAGHDFEQILVFGDAQQLELAHVLWTRSLRIISDRDDCPATADSTTVVVAPLPWILPTLSKLSSQFACPVGGVIPPDSGVPGRRDPTRKLARLLTGRRVGVALGAGAAKGLAHMGVLRAFEELELDIDVISGTSIGAAMAAGWAAGFNAAELSDTATKIAARAMRPTLPMHSFLSSRGIREELEILATTKSFEDLDIPLVICATDIFRRSAVTFTSGLVWPRILASMAIPGIYPPLRTADSYLVDGAVLNPVPARQCRELGAGVVIGVRLTGKATSPREALLQAPSRPYAIDTIMRSLEIMQNHLSEMSRNDADVMVEVCLERGGLRDFGRASEFAEEGYRAVMDATPSLHVVLPYIGAAA